MPASAIRPEAVDPRWDLDTLEATVVRHHTHARLRLRGTFVFNVPQAVLFERVTDPELIAGWLGMIRGGHLDHQGSCNAGAWGVGSKRYCKTAGMGTLEETILHYDPPHSCLYNVRNFMMPVQHHAALMVLEPLDSRQTRFTWRQYYEDKGLIMRHLFPKMMVPMMNDGLNSLVQELGGEAGTMEVV